MCADSAVLIMRKYILVVQSRLENEDAGHERDDSYPTHNEVISPVVFFFVCRRTCLLSVIKIYLARANFVIQVAMLLQRGRAMLNSYLSVVSFIALIVQ